MKSSLEQIQQFAKESFAEQATGLYENPTGLGTAYLNEDIILKTQVEIFDALWEGKTVELPNAGASSFREFFTQYAGFDEVKVIEWSSSAGDWTFGVCIKGVWYPAGQTNRYPYHGFEYWISLYYGSFDSFNELLEHSF